MGLDSELVPGLPFAVSLHPKSADWCEFCNFQPLSFWGPWWWTSKGTCWAPGLQPHASRADACTETQLHERRPAEGNVSRCSGRIIFPHQDVYSQTGGCPWQKEQACPVPQLAPWGCHVGLGAGATPAPQPGAEAFRGGAGFVFPGEACVGAVGGPFPFLLGPCREPFLFLSASSASLFQFSFCTGLPACGSTGACGAQRQGNGNLLARLLQASIFQASLLPAFAFILTKLNNGDLCPP